MTPSDPDPCSVPAPHIPFASSGSYPVRTGNLVRPLIDGIPTFQRIGEAVEQARCSIWLTVTFYADDFRFPDGRGGLFDVLDRAVERGVDVRVLFWRPNPESSGYGRTFPGSQENREMLRARGSRLAIRWDRAAKAYCQHQKSWIIDAGQPTETAFVGGINLTAANLGVPGHAHGAASGMEQRHDLYVELAGPCATDVHHNFVQRWNEASERAQEDGSWGDRAATPLPFPAQPSATRGESLAQVQRMVSPGRYADTTPTPGGTAYDIAHGERSILEQYVRAIDAARRSIYIENQSLPVPEIADRIAAALERGVAVVYLAPADPENHVRIARRNPDRRLFFESVEALGKHENFTLAGLSAPGGKSAPISVYVHAKIMIVDDAWATLGSCNLHANSLFGHTEMNVSVWDPHAVRALRCRLFAEHIGRDTADLDDRTALHLYRQTAIDNRRRMEKGLASWRGLAIALNVFDYGR
jgi:cardiolipin synthase